MSKVLSKSRILDCAQCPKKLFLELYHKDLKAPVTASEQAQFDEGHAVGAEARKRFPGGVLIDGKPWEYEKTHTETQAAIQKGAKVIYEASFLHEGLYVRVDILKRDSVKAPWHVIEVKKSSKVKDEYILDVAAQAEVLKAVGLAVQSYSVMHINSKSVHPDPEGLFTVIDVTERVAEALPELRKVINRAKMIAESKLEPKQDIGPHCDKPYSCGYMGHCWSHVPERSVFELYKTDPWSLYNSGKILLKDLDASDFKSVAQRTIEVVKSGKRFVDRSGLEKEIKKWKFPLYFLDFETLNPALPHVAGTSPYQHTPFQFSCHVLNEISAEPTHFEFLHVGTDDPRPGLIKAIVDGIGEVGSVVSFNKGFEGRVLTSLSKFDRKNAKKLLSIQERLVDPQPLFREFVYDEQFKGSFSIKNVAPAIIGEKASYEGMLVGDGEAAQSAVKALMGGVLSRKEFEKLRDALLAYCRLDTLAMVELVKWIYGEVGDGN